MSTSNPKSTTQPKLRPKTPYEKMMTNGGLGPLRYSDLFTEDKK